MPALPLSSARLAAAGGGAGSVGKVGVVDVDHLAYSCRKVSLQSFCQLHLSPARATSSAKVAVVGTSMSMLPGGSV